MPKCCVSVGLGQGEISVESLVARLQVRGVRNDSVKRETTNIHTQRGARRHAAPVKMRIIERVLTASETVDGKGADDDILTGC